MGTVNCALPDRISPSLSACMSFPKCFWPFTLFYSLLTTLLYNLHIKQTTCTAFSLAVHNGTLYEHIFSWNKNKNVRNSLNLATGTPIFRYIAYLFCTFLEKKYAAFHISDIYFLSTNFGSMGPNPLPHSSTLERKITVHMYFPYIIHIKLWNWFCIT
jgi:hypothetical protein